MAANGRKRTEETGRNTNTQNALRTDRFRVKNVMKGKKRNYILKKCYSINDNDSIVKTGLYYCIIKYNIYKK